MADMHTPLPDYTAMTSGDMLSALRDDASKWAAAFCQTAKKLGIPDIDEGWMLGWFANAIEQSSAVREFARVSQDAETIKALRSETIEEVLSLLTAHELYRYRPKAFDGFIDHCRTALAGSAS